MIYDAFWLTCHLRKHKNNTAVPIAMNRMKSKKAGAIIALMKPEKAAALTKKMTTLSLANQDK